MRTDKRIIRLRKRQPLLTGSEIGRIIGVSRQYVSRILSQEGLHNVQPNYKKVVVNCNVCGKRTPRGQKLCPTGSCRETYYNVEVACAFCKLPFIMKRGHVVQRYKRKLKHIYCSPACYSKGKRDGLS